jgi:hypothetical protein
VYRIVFFIICLQFIPICSPAVAQPVNISISRDENSFVVYRDGIPFTVQGVGLENADVAKLAESGASVFRTWSTDNAGNLLDEALENGLMVVLGLPVVPERSGFDYDNSLQVKVQLENIREIVLRYRDHPALLAWIIGNELNFDYTNPRVYDAVNEISVMIHEIDPNHLTTTTVAGLGQNVVEDLEIRAPDLDILSFQVYGEVVNIPEFLTRSGITRPIWITEWGVVGHWEVERTTWGAPLEMTSTEKGNFYVNAYQNYIQPYSGRVNGNFAFLWGQKQERTPTWFGMFTEDGSSTATIDSMIYIWTGNWPENRAPEISSLTLEGRSAKDNVTVSTGDILEATVIAFDPEGDSLQFNWQLKPESEATEVGGDRESSIRSLPFQPESTDLSGNILFKAPSDPGSYRLFVYIYDGNGNAAHANLPFLVGL